MGIGVGFRVALGVGDEGKVGLWVRVHVGQSVCLPAPLSLCPSAGPSVHSLYMSTRRQAVVALRTTLHPP